MEKHLINSHTKDELAQWSINYDKLEAATPRGNQKRIVARKYEQSGW